MNTPTALLDENLQIVQVELLRPQHRDTVSHSATSGSVEFHRTSEWAEAPDKQRGLIPFVA